MKKYLFVFVLMAGLLGACGQNNNGNSEGLSADLVQNNNGKPIMTFEDTTHDFGTITDGEVVTHTFVFTNTGDGDLIIAGRPVTSCGCTAADYTKEPVKPGQKGKIEVKYDSHGKKGFEKKEVTVVANTTPPNNILTITANVEPAPAP